MHCLKCGTEIDASQAFCNRCLTDMKNYPVSRETPVIIPKRPAMDLDRRGKRPVKPQKAEDLLAIMRKRQRRLVWICVVLSCICLVLLALLLFLPSYGSSNPTIGQNYVTNVTPSSP